MSVSVKIVLFTSKTLSTKEHPIMLRVTKDRKPKYFNLGQSCLADFWDVKSDRPKRKHKQFQVLSNFLDKIEFDAKELLMKFQAEYRDITFEDFEKYLFNPKKAVGYLEYAQQQIEKEKVISIGNAKSFNDALNRFKAFVNNKEVPFYEFTTALIQRFEDFNKNNGVSENSISVYMRALRSIYNRAVIDELAKEESNPFKKYKISKLNNKTKKRALSEVDLRLILGVDVTKHNELLESKNIFLFSFYCRGMNFIDIAHLKWADIKDGRIEYTRQKTGKFYSMGILPQVQLILDYYAQFSNQGYVFPILVEERHITAQTIYNRVMKMRKAFNKDLKALAVLAGIDATNFTSYVARHSYATTLKRKGVSNDIIKENMGHDSEKTTEIYLDDLGFGVLDKANEDALADL
jgi:site-specific recombinase XerD